MLAIGALVTYLGRRVRVPAAILGGAGFGLFIDELGKFITSDNDYFFRPAAALIYVLFLGLFFAARGLSERRPMASAEYVANALDLAADAVSRDLDEREKQRALEMLDRADPHDPVVGTLRRMLAELDALPVRGPRMYTRWARSVGRGYRSLIARPRFAAVIDWVFGVWALLGLAPLALFVASLAIGAPGHALESVVGDLSPVAVVGFASSIVSAALVGLGVRRLEKGARLAAYRAFDRALMVSILVTDTSLFYLAQFATSYRLALDLVLLVTIRYMIRCERALERAAGGEAGATPDPEGLPAGRGQVASREQAGVLSPASDAAPPAAAEEVSRGPGASAAPPGVGAPRAPGTP